MVPRSLLLGSIFALSVSLPAVSQTSGFPAGEILIYSPFATATAPTGAILRLNPSTGQASVVEPVADPQFRPGSICFDPWRDRALFFGNPGPSGQPHSLYELDAAGQLTNLGFSGDTLQLLTPGAGGRIYLRDESAGSSSPLRYLDETNARHDLLDASGSVPFNAPGLINASAMAYEAGSNSLLVAIPSISGVVVCPGGAVAPLTVLRLSLSADGARVIGTACNQFAPDPGGGNYPISLSRMSDGDYLLVVDTNSNDLQPRFLRVDPGSLAVSAFASSGPYTGAAVTDAGCWSSTLGLALFLNNWDGVLQSFTQGATAGIVIPTSMPLTTPGVFGFPMAMVEVPVAGCASTVGFYCTAKTTSGGCSPVLTTSGSPSASAGSGFVVRASQVQAGNFGLLFYGTSGAAAVPFQGGFLCVQPPTTRTGPQASGGAAPCGGSFALDFNAWVASGFDPKLVPGAVVHAQYWFRDPPHPLSGTGLTGGVTFTLCP